MSDTDVNDKVIQKVIDESNRYLRLQKAYKLINRGKITSDDKQLQKVINEIISERKQRSDEIAREKKLRCAKRRKGKKLINEGYTAVCLNCFYAYHKKSSQSLKCPKCGSLDVMNK